MSLNTRHQTLEAVRIPFQFIAEAAIFLYNTLLVQCYSLCGLLTVHSVWLSRSWTSDPVSWKEYSLNHKSIQALFYLFFTLRAILSLMAELGPEFLRGKHWVSVMSSSASRMLKGTVKFPRVHLCLSSFTCALRKRMWDSVGDLVKHTSYEWRFVWHYLHLELLPPGVVNKEWKTIFPQRLLGLEPDLYRQTGSPLLVFN